MIQLRYSTGNPASAIFGFKLNSNDGEEFSFKVDHERGKAKVPSCFIWLSKQLAEINNSNSYFLSKSSKNITYQENNISFYKASKITNIDKRVNYKRKPLTRHLRIYNDMLLSLYNEKTNNISVFSNISIKNSNKIIAIRFSDVWITKPDWELSLQKEYISLFNPFDTLCIGDSKSLIKSDGHLSYEDMSKSLFKEMYMLNIIRGSISSLSKLSINTFIPKTYLHLTTSNYDISYLDSLSVYKNNYRIDVIRDYIGFNISNNNFKIYDDIKASIFHKELGKHEYYKSFDRVDSLLGNYNGTLDLDSNEFNVNINIIDIVKDKKKYINKLYDKTRLYKKENTISRFDLDCILKHSPTQAGSFSDTLFAFRGGLYSSIFDTEESLIVNKKHVGIDNPLKMFYRSDSNLKMSDTYKWMYFNNEQLSIASDNVILDVISKNLFENQDSLMVDIKSKCTSIKDSYVSFDIKEQSLSTNVNDIDLSNEGNSASIRATDIMFDIAGNEAIIGNTLLNFDNKGIDVTYSDELSRWLDSSGKTLGIFSSDGVSNSSDNLSIENYLIMGYNHNKRLDKDNFASLGFEKDSFDFLISEEIRLGLNEKSIVITDNKFGHVNDFLPPIEILKKANDELLLPREGFDYSTYKSQVFGPNLTINQKYIKGFSEKGNPIINVPIENPIGYYADIAKGYIEVDVSIMRRVIELLYKNWRNNIHRHAGLDPSKAINNILEITHKDLLEFYTSVTDKNRIHHAERALKLFAWYCEMGILSHSDKEIIYKKSSGVFDFWSELPQYGIDDKVVYRCISKDEIIEFTNFYYNDENKFILSTSQGKVSSMTISSIPQTSDIRLKFKAYIIGKGVLRVSIDSKVYTYNERINIIDIPLPFDNNEIKIIFLPSNEASSLDIAEFVIEDRYNDSYELAYTGKVKNMNFTLQYVLDFMSVTGDSIEEVQPVLRSTAQLAYALDRFKEYMEIHHDNKFKGKRLTTRK